MSLHRDLLDLERDLDRFEDDLATRHGQRVRPPTAPPRFEGVPPDVLLVGLVGGTGVGKSTLVNALADRDLSTTSMRRPTTDRVVPYLHRRRLDVLDRLDFIRPSLTSAVTPHEVDTLENIILFDLPDIDSSERSHADVVAKALEGLDIVLWVTSLTKYSDRLFHEWIARYARGRDVGNFIFYLNKIDELDPRDGPRAATEVMERFRAAVTASLGVDVATCKAQFFTGAAARPDAKIAGNDLRKLGAELFHERDAREIERIKSSDRIALVANRLDHIARELDLDARHDKLALELDEQRRTFAAVADEKELRREFTERLLASSAAEEAARPIMRRMLSRWPLLPHLSFLGLPLRQLARLSRLPALLAPGSDDAGDRRLGLFGARLAALDLERRARESRRLDLDDVGRPPLEAAEIKRFLDGLENAAIAEIRSRSRIEMEGAAPDSSFVRLLRRIAVWGPLVWFPLLQPILSDLLDPDRSTASLPMRLAYRWVRILGASHLLVSFAFVLAVYLFYFVLMKAAARRQALRSCKALDDGAWWSRQVTEGLIDLFLGPARARLERIRIERNGLIALRERLTGVRAALESKA